MHLEIQPHQSPQPASYSRESTHERDLSVIRERIIALWKKGQNIDNKEQAELERLVTIILEKNKFISEDTAREHQNDELRKKIIIMVKNNKRKK